MLVVVLSFDCLPARFLGAFGSEQAETPGFDELASRSLVFGNARADSTGQAAADALLSGFHTRPGSRVPEPGCGWAELTRRQVHTELLVEAPAMQRPPGLPPADQVVLIDGEDGPDAELFETPFAQLVAEARRRLESHQPGSQRLLWLKSRGVPEPWVPPAGFLDLDELLDDDDDEADFEDFEAASLADEFDDEVPAADGSSASDPDSPFDSGLEPEAEFASVKGESAADEADSELIDQREIDSYQDWVFSGGRLGGGAEHQLDQDDWEISTAGFRGCVRMLDQVLCELAISVLEANDDVVLVVTAASGRELNERLTAGTPPMSLSTCATHVPLMIWSPKRCEPRHTRALVSAVDVMGTVLSLFRGEPVTDGVSLIPDDPEGDVCGRPCLACLAEETQVDSAEVVRADEGSRIASEAAVETSEFRLVRLPPDATAHSGPGEPDRLLFVKPDDFWDWLNVRDLEPERLLEMDQLLDDWLAMLQSHCPVRPSDWPCPLTSDSDAPDSASVEIKPPRQSSSPGDSPRPPTNPQEPPV